MARVLPFPSERERLLAALSPREREFVGHQIHAAQIVDRGAGKVDPRCPFGAGVD
jgi:hypothetical protein